jgi:peptide/nickel transport system permease protein
MFAVTVLAFVIMSALLAPWIAPYAPNALDLDNRLAAPSAAHWLGTDEVGRDMLSRIIHGARPSLSVGLGIVLIGASLGVTLGCWAGFLGGVTDAIVMRLVDILMSLPAMVIALALTAAMGPGLFNATIALGLLSVPFYTRISRGQTLSVREREYVKASRVLGARTAYQLRNNVIPNVLPAVVVFMTFHLGSSLLAASALSFIGLGAQPPMAEWGALVSAGRGYVLDHWWYVLFPGLVIVLTVISVNLLGDALRDALDPRGEQR